LFTNVTVLLYQMTRNLIAAFTRKCILRWRHVLNKDHWLM